MRGCREESTREKPAKSGLGWVGEWGLVADLDGVFIVTSFFNNTCNNSKTYTCTRPNK